MLEVRTSILSHPTRYWPGPIGILITIALGVTLAVLPLSWSAALVLAAAVLILALIQPLFVLALALIAGPFGALESVILGGFALDSGQTLLLLSLAAWVAHGLVRRKIVWSKTPLTMPLILFITIATASLLFASDLALGLKEVVKWVEIAVVMLMVTDLGTQLNEAQSNDGANSENTAISWILIMLFAAGLIQAVIGIWQFAFRGDGPEHFLVLGRFYRAYGTFEQPNPFGGYMNFSSLLAVGVLIGLLSFLYYTKGQPAGSPKAAKDRLLRWLPALAASAFVAAATSLGLLFSWSRGAWMGFLAGLAAMIVFWPRRLRSGLFVFLAAVAVLVAVYQSNLVPPSIVDRVAGFVDDLTFGDVRGVDINDENYAVLERLAHWQAAQDMVRSRPWLGIGFGNYGAAYPDYALINWPDPLGHAHNYYLNILAEIGLVGMAAYVFLWAAIFWQTLRALKRADWPVRGVALGLLGVWAALSVHQVVDKLYVNNIYIHLGVQLGLLQLVDLQTRRETRN